MVVHLVALYFGFSFFLVGSSMLLFPQRRYGRLVMAASIARDAHDGDIINIIGVVQTASDEFVAPVSGQRCFGYAVSRTRSEPGMLPTRDVETTLPRELVLRTPDGDDVRVDASAASSGFEIEIPRGSKLPIEALVVAGTTLAAFGVARWENHLTDGDASPYRSTPLRLAVVRGRRPVSLTNATIPTEDPKGPAKADKKAGWVLLVSGTVLLGQLFF